MSSLESLASPDYRPRRGPTCTVPAILDTADDDTVALFTAALANPHAPGTDIARAMTERGYPIPAHTLQRHRRGECRCGA
jgi:hypothetical protein